MLNGRITSQWTLQNTGSADYGTNQLAIDEALSIGFTDGTGANQANKLWIDQRGVNASSNDDIDLASSLPDNLGGTAVFTKVKGIRIRADAGNLADILIGPAPTNGFVGPFNAAADRVRCAPGGYVDLVNPSAAGWTVTAGTGDILRITNSSSTNGANYKIEVIGA